MKILLPCFGLFVLIFLAACSQTPIISNFSDCVEEGNLVMESYPRQCSADGKTFVEEIVVPVPIEAPQEVPDLKSYTCSAESATVCTMEYNPVCALVDNGIRCVTTPCPSTDAVTYGNACSACAENSLGYYQGTCDNLTFVVCNGDTFTGFNSEEQAKNMGGICVDVCPGNYDSYITQIGLELCIPHYGAEQIATWNSCDRSSEECDCVKAYETTDSVSIENAQYRCVPERYAERLLFRSGLNRLDEQGEQSVMIA